MEFKLDQDDKIRIHLELPDPKPNPHRRRISDDVDDLGYGGLTLPF